MKHLLIFFLAILAAGHALAAAPLTNSIRISQEPVATTVSLNDDVLINSTNQGLGTWTTMRTRVANVVALAGSGGGGGLTNAVAVTGAGHTAANGTYTFAAGNPMGFPSSDGGYLTNGPAPTYVILLSSLAFPFPVLCPYPSMLCLYSNSTLVGAWQDMVAVDAAPTVSYTNLLAGYQLIPGSVGSNSFDAGTKAGFALAGTGGGGVTSGSTLTNVSLVWGTNTFLDVMTGSPDNSTYYVTPVGWDGNLGGVYSFEGYDQVGKAHQFIYTNKAVYGLLLDGNLIAQAHTVTVTNAGGTVVAYGEMFSGGIAIDPTWQYTRLWTNGAASSAYVGFNTNWTITGVSFQGPLSVNGTLFSSVQQAATLGTNRAALLAAELSPCPNLVEFSKGLMKAVAASNQFTFSAGPMAGQGMIAPGSPYMGSYYVDYTMLWPAVKDIVSADTLYNTIAMLAGFQASGTYAYVFPGRVDSLGIASYNGPPIDWFGFVNMVFQHYKLTGSPAAYLAYSNNIALGKSGFLITNDLVWLRTGDFAFYGYDQDPSHSQPAAGYSSMASLLYYDSVSKLGQLAAATGDFVTASNSLAACSNTVVRMKSVLWDSTNSLFRVVSSLNYIHDVFATAYSVYLGACDAGVRQAIDTRFLADWATNSLYQPCGATRITLEGESKFYAYPAGWTARVIQDSRPDLACEMVGKLLRLQTAGTGMTEYLTNGVPDIYSQHYGLAEAGVYEYLSTPALPRSLASGITTNYAIPSGLTLYITNGVIVKVQ